MDYNHYSFETKNRQECSLLPKLELLLMITTSVLDHACQNKQAELLKSADPREISRGSADFSSSACFRVHQHNYILVHKSAFTPRSYELFC